ncbi:MAG TPA: lipocalin family protein [bacterium]|nr:lipocalin family protein [bacterium]HQG44821.1 lipocalin family protein [bacterium]HQI47752.1 lipocalin family protein [bacterium]HQJ63865.1 lipocalin family protein [bacterium]
MKPLFCMVLLAGLAGCAGNLPPGAVPVRDFDLDRYLGNWYEIARLDHSFERGLSRITANYTLNDNGTVRVVNRGYQDEKKKWKEVVGKAKFVGDRSVGRLKVSFFGPFYGGYNIIELDEGYSRVLVCSNSTKYLWILAREPRLPREVLTQLVEKARALNFPVDKLIYVDQSPVPEPPAR